MTALFVSLAWPLVWTLGSTDPDSGSDSDSDSDSWADGDDSPSDDPEYDESEPEPEPEEVTTTAAAPPAVAPIPTEGPTKPPPSLEALKRESPLFAPDPVRRDRVGRPGSPQRFSLEIKMGPFIPAIDRDYDGPGFGPYATIFGQTDDNGATIDEPKAVPLPLLGFEWQFIYLGGPLSVGVQTGFFRDKADALVAQPVSDQLRSPADETTFTIVPMAFLVSYRFELLADRYRIPLVPYAKAGLAYSLYWVKSGSGRIARNSQDERAIGGIPGWQVNLGGMLRLDFIEPGTAKKLDNLTGINHTYILGEYQISQINNFGAGQTMHLGDSTWFAGLAIEF